MSYHSIKLPEYKGYWSLPGNEINLYQTKRPEYKGYWSLPGNEIHLYQTKRPNWFHRTMMSILIGWKWNDN